MEVYQAGTATAEMETGHVFKAATLPAIVLLKLIAYDDRPEKRQKDARDIAGIIQHFFDLQADLIYEYHNDLFAEGAPERTLEEIAAVVIGREMKKMCVDNQYLHDRLAVILTMQINKAQNSGFVRQMTEATKWPVDQMLSWLALVKEGLLE
jgi:predicted nucleotidyltransferase